MKLISSSNGYFLLKDNKLTIIGSKIVPKELLRQHLIIDFVIFCKSGLAMSKSVEILNILPRSLWSIQFDQLDELLF